jgi:hypothetical protein
VVVLQKLLQVLHRQRLAVGQVHGAGVVGGALRGAPRNRVGA